MMISKKILLALVTVAFAASTGANTIRGEKEEEHRHLQGDKIDQFVQVGPCYMKYHVPPIKKCGEVEFGCGGKQVKKEVVNGNDRVVTDLDVLGPEKLKLEIPICSETGGPCGGVGEDCVCANDCNYAECDAGDLGDGYTGGGQYCGPTNVCCCETTKCSMFTSPSP
jgi:hypothetical protein